jgi:MiaB/RimO family radical SAM methylthiotransferase
VPGHAWLRGPGGRRRLDDAPFAYLKLASGCDRRCSFCAIPSFRGSFVSRAPGELIAEAQWLASTGVRELVLVSENSTSYGKDFGELRALEALLPDLAAIQGIARIRVNYLQPAEMRDSLLQVIADTPGVAPYFDLSFQHASQAVLRRMKRFGSTEPFLDLLERARAIAPDAGARSNVIVGFPGETEADFAELTRFLIAARMDAVGVFGYSDEDGTEAAGFVDKLDADVIADRVATLSALADELVAQRAEERIGDTVRVLIESCDEDGIVGRSAHQGPEVDGTTTLVGFVGAPSLQVGQFVTAIVVDTEGADLIATGPSLAGANSAVAAE